MKSFFLLCCVGLALAEQNPEEIGGNYGGDMILTDEQLAHIDEPTPYDAVRGARRWTGNTVNYYIGPEYSGSEVNAINTRVNDFESRLGGCIRFNELSSPRGNYVHIYKGGGCSSYIGMVGGRQDMSLASGCLRNWATTQHEFAHALGFMHTQCRNDRDNEVIIHWDNIRSGTEGNFRRQNLDTKGTPYDFASMMHYGGTAFSTNGDLTIETRDPGNQGRIGQRRRATSGDITRIRRHYGC